MVESCDEPGEGEKKEGKNEEAWRTPWSWPAQGHRRLEPAPTGLSPRKRGIVRCHPVGKGAWVVGKKAVAFRKCLIWANGRPPLLPQKRPHWSLHGAKQQLQLAS